MGRGNGSSHSGGGHSGGKSFGGRSSSNSGRSSRPSGGAGGRGPDRPDFHDHSHRPHYHSHHYYSHPRYYDPYPDDMYYDRPPRRWYRPRPMSSGRFYGGGRSSGKGCGCLSVFAVIFLVLCIISVIIPRGSDTDRPDKLDGIAVTATERTKVSDTVAYKDWYVDQLGWIDHEKDLTDGLKYFYSQTGIQPYVMLLSYDPSFWVDGQWQESAANEYLAQTYASTFSDNGHMILAYFACENDTEDMDGTFYIYYGSSAYSVMDSEAESIFWSYFEMYYNDLDMSIPEFIGTAFRNTADNIMHTGAASPIDTSSPMWIAGKIGAVLLFLALIFLIIRAMRSRRQRNSEEYEQIL